MSELTAAQHRILAEIQRHGRRVYDAHALPALTALVARGMITVGVSPQWDPRRPRARRGYKTYTAYAIGEAPALTHAHAWWLGRDGGLLAGSLDVPEVTT
jgi:hypothetical protein